MINLPYLEQMGDLPQQPPQSATKAPKGHKGHHGHTKEVPGHSLLELGTGPRGGKASGVAQQNAPSFGVHLDHLNSGCAGAMFSCDTL